MLDSPESLEVFIEYLWFFILFPVMLSCVFLVHELGHYVAARLTNTYVEEFSVGFGKKIISWKNKVGTKWNIYLIPLGGFVHIYGDSKSAKNSENSYHSKSLKQKLFIILAGPFTNILFAFLCFLTIYALVGSPTIPRIISGIKPGGSADLAGFKINDELLTFEGNDLKGYGEIGIITEEITDVPFTYTIKRGEEILEIKAASELQKYTNKRGLYQEVGRLGYWFQHEPVRLMNILAVNGVMIDNDKDKARELLKESLDKKTLLKVKTDREEGEDFYIIPLSQHNQGLFDKTHENYEVLFPGSQYGHYFEKLNPVDAVIRSFEETKRVTYGVLYIFGQFFKGEALTPDTSKVTPRSTVQHSKFAHGFVAIFYFSAFISILIGMINLVPFMLFDGGQALKAVILACYKNKPEEKAMLYTEYYLRFTLVIMLGIVLFANINKILENFS
jgi:regulator of sigma E protease